MICDWLYVIYSHTHLIIVTLTTYCEIIVIIHLLSPLTLLFFSLFTVYLIHLWSSPSVVVEADLQFIIIYLYDHSDWEMWFQFC